MKLFSRFCVLIFVAATAGFILTAGCGTDVAIRQEENVIGPAPSDVDSAGVLSGFGYAIAGEHYKTVHSLGSPLAEPLQSSTNGRYQVK